MRTRHLLGLGLALVVAVLGAALITPNPHADAAYVPATVNVAPAAVTAPREATPVTYTLPELTSTPGECGQPNTVTYPDSTDEISYDGFVTSYGVIRVVAVLSDTGRTFSWPATEGWQINPIAPYRAEHLTDVTVTVCEEPAPEPPVTVPEPPVVVAPDPEPVPPVEETPAEEETPHGTNNCRE